MSQKNPPTVSARARPTSRGRSWYPMSLGGEPLISRSRLGLKAYMPALAKLPIGSRGFSLKPVTRPDWSMSTTPYARRVFDREHCQGCHRIAPAVEVDQASQVEIGQVVRVEREEELLVLHPSPMLAKRSCTAQELWLEGSMNCRWFLAGVQVVQHDVGQMVQVDQNLVHLRTMKCIEPEIEKRCPADRQHALRNVICDRPEATARSRRQQKRLHEVTLRTTPNDRMLAFASSSTPSRPSMPSSQSA